ACAARGRGVFFFSSRRRHTRFSRDWSSDVCSSDLVDFLLNSPEAGELLLNDRGLPANLKVREHISSLLTPAEQQVSDFMTEIGRSEEHTSELQSRENLVCRLLLEKKKHDRT